MKNTVLSLFYLLFFLNIVSAQYANTWYFGANAGLDFNTNPPTALSNGMINNPDNVSTISNSAGALLFYTDGMTVWDRNHQVMQNGSGLMGNFTAGQGSLIVPLPGYPGQYVIFQTTEFASPGYLYYSVVDMSLNGGFGDVSATQKNVLLGTGWTEKLCAYYNSIGNFYWVLAHKWSSDQFVAFKVTSNSIATQSVISAVGSVHGCGQYSGAHDAQGQLTISPNGTKILNALTCQDKFELFDFNVSTGSVSNPIIIPGQSAYAWGTAFSPDSKKIYTTSIFGTRVLQYDVSVSTQSAIIASQNTLVTVGSSGYNFGYMELGPNGKLYITRPSQNFLAVVNNPNSAGSASNFSLSGQSLGSKTSTHGLSRIAYNISGTADRVSVKSETNRNNLLEIYPNPFTNDITVKNILPAERNSIQVLDVYGSEVYSSKNESESPEQNEYKVSLHDLMPGIYFVIVNQEYNIKAVKIIKQ